MAKNIHVMSNPNPYIVSKTQDIAMSTGGRSDAFKARKMAAAEAKRKAEEKKTKNESQQRKYRRFEWKLWCNFNVENFIKMSEGKYRLTLSNDDYNKAMLLEAERKKEQNLPMLGIEFEIEKSKDELLIDVAIKKLPLNSGIYKFHLFCSNMQEVFDEISFAGALKVEGGNFFPSGKLPNPKVTKVLVENSWTKLC